MAERKIHPIHESFFNDGHWYVASSSSLGGSGLTPESIAEKLQAEDADTMNGLLEQGICFPLYFDADCELDNVVIIEGALSEKEETEWLGRVRSKLSIPCGEFMLMGGGMPEHFEDALASFEPTDPNYRCFHKLKVPPGTYLIEVYAFLGSYVVNAAWEEKDPSELEKWWSESHPGEEEAEWIKYFKEEEYVDGEELELQEYIIRLTPEKDTIPVPVLHEEVKWVGDFELRKPSVCPVGLKSADYR